MTKSFDLQDFVSSTISQIISGVHEANLRAETFNASVNPSGSGSVGKSNTPILVNFDLAVVAEEAGSAKSGLSVKVLGIGGGVEGGISGKETSSTRISFKVPVQLPCGKLQGSFSHANIIG